MWQRFAVFGWESSEISRWKVKWKRRHRISTLFHTRRQ